MVDTLKFSSHLFRLLCKIQLQLPASHKVCAHVGCPKKFRERWVQSFEMRADDPFCRSSSNSMGDLTAGRLPFDYSNSTALQLTDNLRHDPLRLEFSDMTNRNKMLHADQTRCGDNFTGLTGCPVPLVLDKHFCDTNRPTDARSVLR